MCVNCGIPCYVISGVCSIHSYIHDLGAHAEFTRQGCHALIAYIIGIIIIMLLAWKLEACQFV